MTRRNFLTLGAAWLGAGLAIAGAPQPARNTVAVRKDLRLGLASEPTAVDPHFAALGPNLNLSQHLFDALVHADASGRLVPALATSWRATDPVTWEFKLRTDVRFHDGSALSMEDVLYSLQRPGTITNSPAPFTTFSRQVLSTQGTDGTTLVIKTREPYGGLPGDLSSLFIVSKRAAEGASSADFDSGKAAVGTGPYKLVRFKKGESVVLHRHDAYWDGKPAWEDATLQFLPDEKQRTAALLAGQVDAIEGVPPADAAALRGQPGMAVVQRTSWRTIFLHLEQFTDHSPWIEDTAGQPMRTSPLKDRRVRRALSLAINRPAIARSTMEGMATPAAQLISPGIIGYSPILKPDAYDPVEAKRLLADAGLPNGFRLTLHAPNNRYINDEQIAVTVAQLWSRVGVATHVETLPAATYFNRARRGEFSVAMLGYGSSGADFALRALLGTPDSAKGWGTWNWAKYSNTRLDAALKESLRSTDPVKRQNQAAAAMEIAMLDHAAIPLHHQAATWAMRSGIAYAGRVDEFTLAHQFRVG
ncbi:MAG: ABC transporter substrate-binding protein [Pseudomonadota bacterium]